MINNKILKKKTLTGLGVAAALGTITYIAYNKQLKQNKLKKKTTKAIKALGSVIDSITGELLNKKII